MRVGIIGAGATGLAAAYDLTRAGHQVAVYERSPFLGGHASTFDVGGERLERGYHHWFTSDTDIVDLVQEIGLGDSIRWIDSTVGTLYDGRIYNFVTPMDLLKFKPLNMADRIRLGLTTLYLQRQKNWMKYERITADEWLRKNAGRGPYEVFWGPMLRGKFGEDHYKKVSMAWVWGKINTRVKSRGKSMVKEKLGYPMGSFGQVFDVVTDRIRERGGEVHLSASVESITVEDGRVQGMNVRPADSSVERKIFDAVIATTPSYVFTRLVPPMPQEYMDKLVNVNYLSAVLVILVLDRPLSPKYWMNIADPDLPFVGVIEHTNMIDKALYGGRHIVYLSNYPNPASEMYQKTGEELVEEFIPHLRKINPDFDPAWIMEYHHHKVDGAQPIIGVNYSQRIPDNRTPIKNLYLANTTQIYPEDRGTNYSVRLGSRVARMVLEDAAG